MKENQSRPQRRSLPHWQQIFLQMMLGVYSKVLKIWMFMIFFRSFAFTDANPVFCNRVNRQKMTGLWKMWPTKYFELCKDVNIREGRTIRPEKYLIF